MKIKLFIVLIAAICGIQHTYGQTNTETAIKMRSEVRGQEVLLRWIPTNERAWKLLNKYGVRLERLTVVRDGEVLDESPKMVLTECLKPEESEAFKQMAQEYSFAAIIAQAIFGERFEVSGEGEYDVATIIALGQELQQRYVFSLYAADLCFPAAVVAGWGWKDTNVRQNERYLYNVIPLVPKEELEIQQGGLLVDMERVSRFPKALDLQGNFSDGSVLLHWNFRTLESIYNSYVVERSTDDIHFTPISDLPITQMGSNAQGVQSNDLIYYADSIQNDTTYYYRVAGITPFGSQGAYSDTISGKGIGELKEPPFITKALPSSNGGADIEWEFESSNERFIKGFTLEYSKDDKENSYEQLLTDIDKTNRAIHVPNIQSTHYFRIAAITATGKKLSSFSALVQAIDTIPPTIPLGLVAVADTSGVVRLTWQANKEPDIYGYRIYRGQTSEEELIPVNDVAIRGTMFTDSINLQMLNQKVYYAITALDERYNQSEPCGTVEVCKPEMIPPTPPFIREIKVTNGHNTLHWISGAEPTLAGYEIYKKTGAKGTFELLTFIQGADSTSYADSEVENDHIYIYQLKSCTQGGLRSISSPDYQVRAINKTEGSNIKVDLTLTPLKNNIQISWKTTALDVTSVQLYKKTNDGVFGLFRDKLNPTGEIADKAIAPGFTYQYMLVIKTNHSTPITLTKKAAL